MRGKRPAPAPAAPSAKQRRLAFGDGEADEEPEIEEEEEEEEEEVEEGEESEELTEDQEPAAEQSPLLQKWRQQATADEQQQQQQQKEAAVPRSSADHLLMPFRTIGMVCGSVGPCLYGGEDRGQAMALCPAGRCLHTFKLARMRLVHVSVPFPRKIRACARTPEGFFFVAAGGDIYCMKRHRVVWSATHTQSGKVHHLVAGSWVAVSIASDNTVKVWHPKDGRLLQSFALSHQSTISCACRVRNYTTRLLFGCRQGHLELWNFNTGTLVHKFGSLCKGSPVTALCSAPADDTVGIGFADGTVVSLNVLYGTELLRFKHTAATQVQQGDSDGGCAVTALDFRRDRSNMLVSGTERGEVAVWDLKKQQLAGLLAATGQTAPGRGGDRPHNGRITGLSWFPRENLLLTSGEDNAIRVYEFDTLTDCGTLVRERRGHSKPCNGVLFYDEDTVVTHSADRTLRASHTFHDRHSVELSQGDVVSRAGRRGVHAEQLRLPPVSCAASCTTRKHDWASLITGHERSRACFLWRMDNFAQEQSVLYPPFNKGDGAAVVTAVTISQCGHFAIVGMDSGRLHAHNLQSREWRCSYRDPTIRMPLNAAHSARILGLHVSADNSNLVSVAAEKVARIWQFPPSAKEDESPPLLFQLVIRGSLTPVTTAFAPAAALLGMAHGDHMVRVYDVDPLHLRRKPRYTGWRPDADRGTSQAMAVRLGAVRRYGGHDNAVTGLCFSPDRRLLLSTSLDGTMRFCDLPTARVIDVIRFSATVTSVAFHPESLFVATTHAHNKGVMLWTNKLKYGHIPTPITDASAMLEAPLLELPQVTADGLFADEDDEEDQAEDTKQTQLYDPSHPELNFESRLSDAERRLDERAAAGAEGMVSLGGLPKAKWANLAVLDQIRRRNKPIAPPKKIEAPFFLPSQDEAAEHAKREAEALIAAQGGSRMLHTLKDGAVGGGGELGRLLRAADWDGALAHLERIGAAKVEVALRDLTPPPPPSGAERVGEGAEGDEEAQAAAKAEREEGARRLGLCLQFFEHHLRRKAHFEVVEGLLALFLKLQGLAIAERPELRRRLREVETLHSDLADRVGELADRSLSLIRYLVAPA